MKLTPVTCPACGAVIKQKIVNVRLIVDHLQLSQSEIFTLQEKFEEWCKEGYPDSIWDSCVKIEKFKVDFINCEHCNSLLRVEEE